MKTREELADSFALKPEHQADLPKSAPMTLHQIVLRHGYLAGFDAGFARAVETLRAVGAVYTLSIHGSIEGSGTPVHVSAADWLEKQCP